jgi:hypothetical protein
MTIDNETTTPTPNLSAVHAMVEKLDNRRHDSSGYVTKTPEVIDILSQLSKLVPASIVVEPSIPGAPSDYISVMIKVGFTVSREELGI